MSSNTTLFYTQLFSVLSTCIALGMNMTNLGMNVFKSLKKKHPKILKFLPNNPLKQLGIFTSMIIWSTLHLFIYSFGISVLFAKGKS